MSRRQAIRLGGAVAGGVAAAAGTATLAGAAAPQQAARGSSGEGPVVARTRLGALRGSRKDDVTVWKGVRFAEPPTGRYRFAPPRPVTRPWTGVQDATQVAAMPLQLKSPLAKDSSGPQDEDCLFLNIWSRSTRGRKPVIVWITGGGFRAGAGSNFDGTAYAQQHDVVLVTINYRVNAFGYLYQPDRPGSGNCGLLDQIEALRWVRDNITAFGGDPRNVTVMGESAGGMSIGILLGTPAARGLFHRAIIQSGGVRPTVMQQGKEATTRATLRALGFGQDQADRLTDVPARDLLAATAEVNKGTEIRSEPFHPLIDNVVLHTHPLNRIPADVDLLIGTSDRDYLPDPTWKSEMEFIIRYAAGDKGFDRLLQTCTESTGTGRDPRMDLLGSAFVQMPSIWLAEHAHRVGARVWQYTFDYADAGPAGALHGSDTPFTFGKPTPERLAQGADFASAQRLADVMVASFSSFARTGNPAIRALPRWPAFTPGNRVTMSFDATPRLKNDRLPAERRHAWDGIDPLKAC